MMDSPKRQKRRAEAPAGPLGYAPARTALVRLWTGLQYDIPPELKQLPDNVRGARINRQSPRETKIRRFRHKFGLSKSLAALVCEKWFPGGRRG